MGTTVAPSLTDLSDRQPRFIDATGWLAPAARCPSPNFNTRPIADDISLVVIHNISLPPGEFGRGYIKQFFCNQLPPDDHPYFPTICHLEVSAHCLVDRCGVVTQFVSFADRAWHAGTSSFAGRVNCNDFSIGIELEGTDDQPYTPDQYTSLVAITHLLLARYPSLDVQRIVGHSTIAPGRKTDPGPSFDWPHYFALLGR